MEKDDEWRLTEEEKPTTGMLVLGYDSFYGDVMVCVRRPGKHILPLNDDDDVNIVLWRDLPMPSFEKIKKAKKDDLLGIGYDQRAA